MDYEKAYKAVLKTATQWIKDGCTDKEKICLEYVFPELRKSEDERIGEELLLDIPKVFPHDKAFRYIAWLEKRKSKERYDRMAPIYEDKESFESALDKAWKFYNDSGSSTVDGCEDNAFELAFSKGFREGFLCREKQKEPRLAFTWRRVEDVTTKRTDEGDCVTTEKILVKGLIDDEDYRIVDKDVMVNNNLLCIPVRELNVEQKPIELSDNFEIALEEFLMNADSSSQTYAEDVKKYANKLRGIVCKEQKEQKPTLSKSEVDFADTYSKGVWEKILSQFKNTEGYHIGCNDVSDIVLNAILDAFKWAKSRQNAAEWSEEDETCLEHALWCVMKTRHFVAKDACDLDACRHAERWLESLHERFNLQPKQEWSEEDEKWFEEIELMALNFSDDASYRRRFFGWLKSFKDRVQSKPHWKPSEEQISALERAIVKMHTPNDIGILAELRDNLKKL